MKKIITTVLTVFAIGFVNAQNLDSNLETIMNGFTKGNKFVEGADSTSKCNLVYKFKE